ncbi:MAG TPA: DUF58 domain-containing protein [Gemmatimonadaceae bacterium]|nr:DUF58 domain-containing protein [Gemmatimonadaceae bacterium]
MKLSEVREALRYHPTRRLAAALVLLSPLWLLTAFRWGWVVALGALGLLLLAALADALALPAARDLAVDRELPPTIGVGDSAEGEVRVTSSWDHAVRVRLYDQLPTSLDQPAKRAHDARPIPKEGGSAAFPFTVRGRVRGRWPLGPIVLRAVGPLGLMERSLSFPHRTGVDEDVMAGRALADSVIVAPSIAGIGRFRLLALQQRLRDTGSRTIKRRGEGMSFAGLREYVIGDDPRRIDWKASARRDKLIAREFTIEQGQTVLIAVDAGRLMTQLAGEYSRFEHALSAALILADVALSNGDRVGCIVFDDDIRAFVPPGKGRATLQRIRDALVPAVATMAEPDYALAFRTLAARHRKRSLVVVFTDAIDVRASQSLIAHTSRSAARHLPLVVALRNDELAAVAVPEARESTEGVYESAAAEELLSARDEALWRMRRAGVSVLDVSPTKMTAAVINRYLELKGRSAV